jgi:hypothetical protein
MSAYEELVERCEDAAMTSEYDDIMPVVLAEVLRTLETVTPEMESALENAIGSGAVRDWLTALALCPLNPSVQP